MSSVLGGIALLIALIGLQVGMRYWTTVRTRRAWEEAQAAMARHDFESAATSLDKTIKLMPLWTHARMIYGVVLSELGRLPEAEEQLKMAADLQPKEADGHIELGIFYVTTANRPEEGITALRVALACDEKARYRIETEPRLRDFRDGPHYAQLESA